METKRIKISDTKNINDEELKEAAQILRDGGLVAFPTETVYGLGGNALDEKAAGKIYAAKGRPSDNPLIAHVSCAAEVTPLVKYIPEAGKKLMDAFWPGPLTIIFPKSDIVPYGTTGGLDTVAVRMPVDPVANRLIALAGVPVAAPSANTSGRPSPTTADHVWQDLNGKIEMIIDGGPVGIGVESTIVDVSGDVPAVLRPGAITMEMLKDEPIILFNTDSVQTQTVITRLRSAGITPNVHMYCSQLVTVLNFVRGGKCGAFLYSSLAANPRDFVEIPITPEITSKFGIIWKKGIFVPDQLTKFVNFVKDFDVTPYLPKFS